MFSDCFRVNFCFIFRDFWWTIHPKIANLTVILAARYHPELRLQSEIFRCNDNNGEIQKSFKSLLKYSEWSHSFRFSFQENTNNYIREIQANLETENITYLLMWRMFVFRISRISHSDDLEILENRVSELLNVPSRLNNWMGSGKGSLADFPQAIYFSF